MIIIRVFEQNITHFYGVSFEKEEERLFEFEGWAEKVMALAIS